MISTECIFTCSCILQVTRYLFFVIPFVLSEVKEVEAVKKPSESMDEDLALRQDSIILKGQLDVSNLHSACGYKI